jgi:hypothetical protein
MTPDIFLVLVLVALAAHIAGYSIGVQRGGMIGSGIHPRPRSFLFGLWLVVLNRISPTNWSDRLWDPEIADVHQVSALLRNRRRRDGDEQ